MFEENEDSIFYLFDLFDRCVKLNPEYTFQLDQCDEFINNPELIKDIYCDNKYDQKIFVKNILTYIVKMDVFEYDDARAILTNYTLNNSKEFIKIILLYSKEIEERFLFGAYILASILYSKLHSDLEVTDFDFGIKKRLPNDLLKYIVYYSDSSESDSSESDSSDSNNC